MTTGSEYVVYVDESGDHGLTQINPQYPVFVLAFCVFRIQEYITSVVPLVQRLKFDVFGHDLVVLHERDIRKASGQFAFLTDRDRRQDFMGRLDAIVRDSPFSVICSAIRKQAFVGRRGTRMNPYHVALEYGLERVFMHLQSLGQADSRTAIVFEGRGAKEDAELELEFRRIMDQTRLEGMAGSLAFHTAHKQTNSSGLQIADLVARPVGLRVLRPEQDNRAWDVIRKKVRTSPSGEIAGWGLKVYP